MITKSSYINALWREKLFIKYATIYDPKHSIQRPVVITDQILVEFKNFIDEYEFKYSLPGEKELNKLEKKLLTYASRESKKNLFDKLLFWRKSKEQRLIKNLNSYSSDLS